MCVAVPGKVISIEKNNAKVDFLGAFREVSLDLLNNVAIGDYILAHAGYAIEKIDNINAEETIKLFKDLKEFVEND